MGNSPTGRVVKLPVIGLYVGSKLPVTVRPLLTRLGHLALVLKGVGQSLGVNLSSNLIIIHSEHLLDMKFATLVCRFVVWKLLLLYSAYRPLCLPVEV